MVAVSSRPSRTSGPSRPARPSPWRILRALPKRISRHNVTVAAAGIAFYGLLALVPTLVATVSIYGLVNQGNEAEIKDQIESAAGSLDDSTKEFVQGQLTEITSSDGNLLALLLSILLALFSSSGAVQKLMGTISLAYEADETRPGWLLRILAYGLTAAAIVAVVLMVFVVGVLPEILDQVNLGGPAELAINLLRLPAFALFFVFGLTVLYRSSPDRTPKTPWVNPGAWVATGLWLVFAIAFSLYSSNIGAMPASYGLLGTVAALMIFLQVTAVAVIVGAEYNAEREGAVLRSLTPVGVAAAGAAAAGATAAGAAAGPGARGAVAVDGSDAAPGGWREAQPVGFAAALAGLVALLVLGRSQD